MDSAIINSQQIKKRNWKQKAVYLNKITSTNTTKQEVTSCLVNLNKIIDGIF